MKKTIKKAKLLQSRALKESIVYALTYFSLLYILANMEENVLNLVFIISTIYVVIRISNKIAKWLVK